MEMCGSHISHAYEENHTRRKVNLSVPLAMLTRLYIEALLVNKELADQAWDRGEIDDAVVFIAWMMIAGRA